MAESTEPSPDLTVAELPDLRQDLLQALAYSRPDIVVRVVAEELPVIMPEERSLVEHLLAQFPDTAQQHMRIRDPDGGIHFVPGPPYAKFRAEYTALFAESPTAQAAA